MDAKKLIEDVLFDLGNNKSLTDVSSKMQIIVNLSSRLSYPELWFKGIYKNAIPILISEYLHGSFSHLLWLMSNSRHYR